MKKKLKKQELILASVWLIIIAIIIGEAVVRKATERFLRIDEEIALSQAKLLRLNAVLKQEKEVNAVYDRALAGYKPVKDSDSLLQQIENIARRLNVNILNIKPAASKEEGAYRAYSIKIDGQDDVASISKFLFVLIEELRSLGIDKLQISSPNRDELPKVSVVVNTAVFTE